MSGDIQNGLSQQLLHRERQNSIPLHSSKLYDVSMRVRLDPFSFLIMLAEQGIKSVKLPPQPPNLKTYVERFVQTIKESCLEQMILFAEDALRNTTHEFVANLGFKKPYECTVRARWWTAGLRPSTFFPSVVCDYRLARTVVLQAVFL